MRENARRFLRQKLGSIGTVFALAALGLLSAAAYASGGAAGTTATLATFLIGGGIVARDASSGALQMILVRPVRRVDYLMGRFGGAAILLAGFLVSALLVAALLVQAARLAGWLPGEPSFPWKLALESLLGDFANGLLVLATLLFLSTFLRGVGDVLAFVLAAILLKILPQVGQTLKSPLLVNVPPVVSDNVSPKLPLDQLFSGQFAAPAAGAWLLALVAFLALACLVFNRREFSYGTD